MSGWVRTWSHFTFEDWHGTFAKRQALKAIRRDSLDGIDLDSMEQEVKLIWNPVVYADARQYAYKKMYR